MQDIDNYEYFYDGTNISIKDVQDVELEILIEFDRICRKMNIPYQLCAGTLLGAVRHKGFIPWDDDVDVCMRRCDYDRFLQCCPQELNDKYFLQTCFTDPTCVVQFAKIRKNGTAYENALDASAKYHTGIWIDIFPMDNVNPNSLAGKYQRLQVMFYYAFVTSSIRERVTHCKGLHKRLIRSTFYNILKIVPKARIDKKLDEVYRKFNNEDTEYLGIFTNGVGKNYWIDIQPSDGFYDLIELDFCGRKFMAPKNYDEILKNAYGDYMSYPPIEDRCPSHGITNIKI